MKETLPILIENIVKVKPEIYNADIFELIIKLESFQKRMYIFDIPKSFYSNKIQEWYNGL